MYASYHGSLETVKLLVKRNADIFVKDYNDKSACDIAYHKHHLDIWIYLNNKMKVFNFDNIIRIQEYFRLLEDKENMLIYKKECIKN
jgi:ankyrin repeat protein